MLVQLNSSAGNLLPLEALRRGYVARGKIVTRSERAIALFIERVRSRVSGVGR